jgi:hypothetical protein
MSAAEWSKANRLGGLRRFAFAITLFNVLGHTLFGFEQSWLQPFVALGTAYALELVLELVGARLSGRRPRYAGGPGSVVDFLLSAHISALAVSMLLYANDRLWVVAFAVAAAIGSKVIARVRVGGRSCHFLNPSNLGITLTLLLFPWVGIAPPYHFTENLAHVGDWVLPCIIVVSGSFLNARYTKRVPLLAAWIGVFALQALVRSTVFGTPLVAALLPMTGVAFVLYTFYMVTDPATTPAGYGAQVLFGGAVAATYGLLLVFHVVFGFFFALTIVCVLRGLILYGRELAAAASRTPVTAPAEIEVPALGEG